MTAVQDKFYTDAFIKGGWKAAPRTFSVVNPSTGAEITRVADCTPDMARDAIEAAVTAFSSWKKTPPYERGKLLRRWFELLMEHTEPLARLMALEMGKTIKEARGEVAYAAGFVEFYADECSRMNDELIPSKFPHKRGMARYEAVGVVYAVTPWNFPLAMITRKVGPALAAGCVVINKPAELSPLTALYAAQLWREAGGPEGTLQVLPTNDPVAFSAPFFEDDRVRKLTFTGSTEVGKILYRQSAATMKRVSLELGGHAPVLVFADADLDETLNQVFFTKWRNNGQTCITANRFYVHSSIAEEFARRLSEQAAALVVGDALEEATQVGPLVEQQGLDKVVRHVDDAVSKGATLMTGGHAAGGLFFEPTVLSGVKPGMVILEEETFGPVAPVVSFETEEEAVQAANNSPYGLAAYVFTRDLSRAFRVSEALEYGIIGVNDGAPFGMNPQSPFGGVKQSGIGREGGRWGLEEYLSVKYVSMGI